MDAASPTANPLPTGTQTDEVTSKTNSRKKRRRNFTQDDRAQHRILEKQRREAFNDRMLELARLLPRVAAHRQLSKHVIVNESIRKLKAERSGRAALISGLKALMAERDDLLQDVNRLGRSYNPQHLVIRQARPIDTTVLEMIKIEDRNVEESIPPFSGTLGNGGAFDEDDEADEGDNINAAACRVEDGGVISTRLGSSTGSEPLVLLNEPPAYTVIEPILHLPHVPSDMSFIFDPPMLPMGEAQLSEPLNSDLLDPWSAVDASTLPFPDLITMNGQVNEIPWTTELPASFDIPSLNAAIFQDNVGYNNTGNLYYDHAYQSHIDTSTWP